MASGLRASAASGPPSSGDALRGEEREEGVELVEQLGQPLEGEVLGHDDEHALGEAELAQAGEDQARLDRLAEAHLVGEDEARHAVGEDAAGGADLVRAARGRGRRGARPGSRRGAAPPGGRRGCAARKAPARPGRPRGQRVERARRPQLSMGVSCGDRGERRVAAGHHRHPVAAGEAHRQPATLVGDLDDHADAPGPLGAVHHLHARLPDAMRAPLPPDPGRSRRCDTAR